MKSKKIYEHNAFKQGRDPLTALDIGKNRSEKQSIIKKLLLENPIAIEARPGSYMKEIRDDFYKEFIKYSYDKLLEIPLKDFDKEFKNIYAFQIDYTIGNIVDHRLVDKYESEEKFTLDNAILSTIIIDRLYKICYLPDHSKVIYYEDNMMDTFFMSKADWLV